MRFTAGGLALAAVVGIFVANARGDGKFFVPEQVPPGVPYQRAFLIFHDDSETLILQSKYDFRQSVAIDSFGWVVPVPAVPEIASTEPAIARHCFFTAALRTQPRLFHISGLLVLPSLLLFLSGIAFLLLCVVQYPFLGKIGFSKLAWGRRARNGTVVTGAALFFLLGVTTPHLGRAAGGVDVVKDEKAGIYDVRVIRGDAEAITVWLRENRFSFDEEDKKVFQGYVDRGWCFVTAKVEPGPGADDRQIVAEGIVAPLILKFASDKPVYPLALTATTESKTEMLIYTFSDNKLICGERLRLRHARPSKDWGILSPLLVQAQIDGWSLFDDLPERPMMLCKFKGRLAAAQMRQDLTFALALDDEPYRERKTVW